MSDLEGFEITGKRTVSKGKSRKVIYSTTAGDLYAIELASHLGLSLPGLNTRINTYGLKDPRVVHGPRHNKENKPNWEGLSSKKRDKNLARLEGKTMSYYLNSGRR